MAVPNAGGAKQPRLEYLAVGTEDGADAPEGPEPGAKPGVSASAIRLSRWTGLLRVGGWAALGSVALLVVQVVVFVIWPPVRTVGEVFQLLVDAPVRGLLSLDLLYLVNNLLVWLFYVGLGVVLRSVSRSGVVLAVGLGTLQVAAYIASNPALELLWLARAHAAAGSADRPLLVAAGQALLARWQGTAFVTYYLLGAVVLLILAWLLRRSPDFSRATSWWALAGGVLMLVPSPFGTVGLVFSLASLVPWSVLCVLAGRRLLTIARRPE